MAECIELLFSTTPAWQSRVIRFMCNNSLYSHVDIVIPSDNGQDYSLLGASDPGGVLARPKNYEVMLRARRMRIYTPLAPAIRDRAMSQIGKPFDDGALYSFLRDEINGAARDWRELSKWFCAELVLWAFEAENFFAYPLLILEDRVTPPMLISVLNPYCDTGHWLGQPMGVNL